MSRHLLFIGATRGTGTLVVNGLLARGDRVRIAARNVEKARALFGDRASIVACELTSPGKSLDSALAGVDGVVFTAAVPPGVAGEELIRLTDYGGVVAALDAARRCSFGGRFVYMTTMGVHHPTFPIVMLGWLTCGIVKWRRHAEEAVGASGLDAVVVRAGLPTNGPSSALDVASGESPPRASCRTCVASSFAMTGSTRASMSSETEGGTAARSKGRMLLTSSPRSASSTRSRPVT